MELPRVRVSAPSHRVSTPSQDCGMRDDLDDFGAQKGPVASPITASAVRFALGVVLMPLGIVAIVGGAVLHFAIKAGKVELFRYAGRFTIVLGLAVTVM